MIRRLIAALLREWIAAKRAIKRPALRWLLDRIHAWLAGVPQAVIREGIQQSFKGDSDGLLKATAECRAILGADLRPADAALLAMLDAAALEHAARMN